MVSVEMDGWEIYVKEVRPKGRRAQWGWPRQGVALHYNYVPKDEMTSYLNMVVDLIAADLPGEPEHSEPHEVKEPEMDGELIDAILEPFLEQPPFVSDERDIDEGDEDEVIALKNSIVGSSASQLGQRKLKSHAAN